MRSSCLRGSAVLLAWSVSLSASASPASNSSQQASASVSVSQASTVAAQVSLEQHLAETDTLALLQAVGQPTCQRYITAIMPKIKRQVLNGLHNLGADHELLLETGAKVGGTGQPKDLTIGGFAAALMEQLDKIAAASTVKNVPGPYDGGMAELSNAQSEVHKSIVALVWMWLNGLTLHGVGPKVVAAVDEKIKLNDPKALLIDYIDMYMMPSSRATG